MLGLDAQSGPDSSRNPRKSSDKKTIRAKTATEGCPIQLVLNEGIAASHKAAADIAVEFRSDLGAQAVTRVLQL